jgi:hypothetical protein
MKAIAGTVNSQSRVYGILHLGMVIRGYDQGICDGEGNFFDAVKRNA